MPLTNQSRAHIAKSHTPTVTPVQDGQRPQEVPRRSREAERAEAATPQRPPRVHSRERTPTIEKEAEVAAAAAARAAQKAAASAAMPPPAPKPVRPGTPPQFVSSAQEPPAFAEDEEAMSQTPSIAEDEYPPYYKSPGVLRVMYPSEVPRPDRRKVYPYQVLGAYTVASSDIKGMPPLTTNGMAPGIPSIGIFSLYICFEAAKDFARYHPTLTVTADVESPSAEVELVTRAYRVMHPSDALVPLGLPASYIDEECGYIEVYLDSDQKMAFLHRDDFIPALKKMGLHVFLGSRGQIKYPVDKPDGSIDWAPMGKETMTDKLNFTIKPCGLSMGNYKWRQFLDIWCWFVEWLCCQ